MPLIRANNLSRYYGNNCAVSDISFTLNAGDILGFLGPNGAGKSTTMQMLSGNLAPSTGEISIDGIDLLDEPKAAKSVLGYLPEQPPVYREMTVDEYLTFCARLHRIARAGIDSAVETTKRRCGLNDVGHRLIANLSKGYQQRAGIAQAIIHSPKVIILDEPTVGLDPIQIREIRELIISLGKEHGIILSTHILPEVQAVCNRVQIINQGELVFESSMQDLMQQESVQHYDVAFKQHITEQQLGALDCVGSVQTQDNGYMVTLDTTADVFVRATVEQDWGLNRLIPQQQTLENIFISLAHKEAQTTDAEPTEAIEA